MKSNIDLLVEAQQIHETWLTKNGGFAKDMTMRDHYAGRAMQKMLGSGDYQTIAECAYAMADAMLKAREGK